MLFGWPRSGERAEVMFRHVRSIAALGKSVVVVVDKGLPPLVRRSRRIDIWWRGQENGSLMATLAHLLIQNWEWRDSQVRVLRVVRDEAGRESSRQVARPPAEAPRLVAEARLEPERLLEDAALARARADADHTLSRDSGVPRYAAEELGHVLGLLGPRDGLTGLR